MRKFGWKPDLPDYRDLKYSLHVEYKETPLLPPSVDLRPDLSPIEDQGQLGSCVANATCGNLEYLQLRDIRENEPGPERFGDAFDALSRLFLYYNCRAIDGDISFDNGTQIRTAILSLRDSGICRETSWAYDTSQVYMCPPPAAYIEAAQHTVTTGYRIDNTNLTAMKQCLANGFVFVFGVSIYTSFMSDYAAKTGIIFMPRFFESKLGGHALCCVGYDDKKKDFLVRNSWGAGWGDQGYCWMPYTYLNDAGLCSDVWTIRKN